VDTIRGLEECYQTLEVDLRASPRAIKRQYRRLVKQWHPDLYPNGSLEQKRAVERTQKINQAYRRIRHAPFRYRATGPAPAPPRPRPGTPAQAVKPVYGDGELQRQSDAAGARRESIVRRAIGLGFAVLVALVLGGAWIASGWLLLILGPLTEALLLSRWSRSYFRTGLVVVSVTVPAPAVPLPSAIDADLTLEFEGSQASHPFSLIFRRFSPRALAFRGMFHACPEPFCLLGHLIWPLLLHGEIRSDGTSPCVTVRGQCAWSILVGLVLSGWGLFDAGAGLLVLLVPAISGVWLIWVRSRVRTIARAVTTLLELQTSRRPTRPLAG